MPEGKKIHADIQIQNILRIQAIQESISIHKLVQTGHKYLLPILHDREQDGTQTQIRIRAKVEIVHPQPEETVDLLRDGSRIQLI